MVIRITYVHNYYQQAGGEDKVVTQEIQMLREHGHEVLMYTRHNDEIQTMSIWGKIAAFFQTIWSPRSYKDFKRFLMLNKPDVVHFHNFFPLISTSAYYAAKKLDIPVVQTLHNYRLICPAATFLREGKICEKCLDTTLLHSISHGCYRESRVQSASVAAMLWFNRIARTWNSKVDRYIALTEFAKWKFIQSGLPAEKVIVKPNFMDNSMYNSTPKKEFFLFVGRISKEKGVDVLVDSWMKVDASIQLIIIGEGPELSKLKKDAAHHPNIIFMGKQDSNVVIQHMKEARFVVVPSVWYEGFPMTIVEAFSVGTPVICSNVGSLKEIVVNNRTGFHFEMNQSEHLAEVIQKAAAYDQYPSLCTNVREQFKKAYTKDVNYTFLMGVYEDIVKIPVENKNSIRGGYVVDSRITAISLKETVGYVERWIKEKFATYICVCNTHSLVTASKEVEFQKALSQAGICTPDGMPLVWALRALGFKEQERVDGPVLMKELCQLSADRQYKVYLYGSTMETLNRLKQKLEEEFTGIEIVGICSPPFGNMDLEEEKRYINEINASKPDIVFIGLGCPKQELWMNRNQDLVEGVMVGVGAAFDYLVGNISRPPLLMQKWGLEWLFRLYMEPKRLWKRYMYNNPVFIYKYIMYFHRNKKKTIEDLILNEKGTHSINVLG